MKIKFIIPSLALSVLLSGCQEIGSGGVKVEPHTYKNIYDTTAPAETALPPGAVTTHVLAGETTAAVKESVPSGGTTAPAGISAPQTPETPLKDFTLNERDSEFLSRCTFVGDSICSGIYVYKYMPRIQVFAVGDTAARNILDNKNGVPVYTFANSKGNKVGLMSAIADTKPPVIAISFGMNDLNVTDTAQFTKDYTGLIEKMRAQQPGVKVIAVSITPISIKSKFTTNKKIDAYNAALKKAIEGMGVPDVIYTDINSLMKDGAGNLNEKYVGSTDGVHLTNSAYRPILYGVCKAAETAGF